MFEVSPGISHKYLAFVSFTSFCTKKEIFLLIICNLLSLEFANKGALKLIVVEIQISIFPRK